MLFGNVFGKVSSSVPLIGSGFQISTEKLKVLSKAAMSESGRAEKRWTI